MNPVSSDSVAELQAEIVRLTLKNAALEAQISRLQKDELTDLPSRNTLTPVLHTLIGIAKRQAGFDFSVILLDADFFKGVNDSYGHAVGDEVLRHIANTLKSTLRTGEDYLAVGRARVREAMEGAAEIEGRTVPHQAGRWGGEEFIVLLPGSSRDAAEEVARRIRAAVESPIETIVPGVVPLEGKTPRKAPISVSLGVATFQNEDDAASLLKRVDAALYRAKENGRNQVAPAPAAAETRRVLSRWPFARWPQTIAAFTLAGILLAMPVPAPADSNLNTPSHS
jgi:GGDEF domain-containing protein